MTYIGYTPTQTEYSQDRKTYTAGSGDTKFGVQYSDQNVSVYLNGVKMALDTDFATDASGLFITFLSAVSAADIVDLVGQIGITNIDKGTFEKFQQIIGTTTYETTNFTVTMGIDDPVNVYINGILQYPGATAGDYTRTTAQIQFNVPLVIGDVLDIQVIKSFTSAGHLTRADLTSANGNISHFSNNEVTTGDLFIPSGINSMMVGPVSLGSTIVSLLGDAVVESINKYVTLVKSGFTVSHGMSRGNKIQFSNVAPTGASLTTDYWIHEVTDTTFKISSTNFTDGVTAVTDVVLTAGTYNSVTVTWYYDMFINGNLTIV